MTEKSLMTKLYDSQAAALEQRRHTIFQALMNDYFSDVQNRFELMTTMNNQALAEYRSSPVVQENFLKSFENISPDFQADVLTKFYKNNTEQFSRLEQCLKKHDASALNQMYQAEKQKNQPDFFKIRAEKGGWRYIGPHGQQNLFQNKTELLEKQINRHTPFDGTVNVDGKQQALDGYCAAGIVLSLYKMKDYFGSKPFDFLPEAKTAVWPENLVEHLKDSPYVHHVSAGQFTELSDKQQLQPGTLFISTRKNGRPHHMMMYERRENGTDFLMGFNDDKKNTPANKTNGVIIDIPGMIRNNLSKMNERELTDLEQKLSVPVADRQWENMITEGKSYSPEQQWETYYRRSDVKFDVQQHTAVRKQEIINRRQKNESR